MNNKAKELQEKLDETKKIMVQNINYTLARGEKLDSLVQKSEDLKNDAEDFRIRGKIIKEKLWWQKARMTMALMACGMILVIIIVIIMILFFRNGTVLN